MVFALNTNKDYDDLLRSAYVNVPHQLTTELIRVYIACINVTAKTYRKSTANNKDVSIVLRLLHCNVHPLDIYRISKAVDRD